MTSLNGHNGAAPTVLVVEDDPATRRLYKFLLSNGGYSVVEADDGIVALEVLGRCHCDMVITDMNMPRMDGIELIKAIRLHHPGMYVIMVTAFGTPDTEKQAMRTGANDYLAKPFEFDELERRVHAFFQQQSKVA